jgi:hypothetical protein
MHLQVAILFAQEVGKLFVLTAWNRSMMTQNKILKILAVDPENMFFLCISLKQVPNLTTLSL